jgi:ABC-type Fe3+/spermidine/putrescine transport system ATPase subunit
MSQGVVEQVSSPAEIYENPQSAFVANFIGVSNIYPSEIKALSGGVAECVTDGGLRVIVSAREHGDLAVGAKVGVVIRPEKLLITAEHDATAIGDRENVYPAVIKAVVYVGSVTQFIVSIGERHLAQVLQQNLLRTERDEWREGQRVDVSFWATSCSLITDIEGGLQEKDLMGEVVRRM